MGSIAHRIKGNRERIVRASREIATCLAEIEKLQLSCKHNWGFNRQVNNHDDRKWNVTYKCTECDSEHTDENRPPVCEACNISLVRAKKNDDEAEKERKKEKYQGHYNPPIAFRCPECGKIHILWLLGD